MEWPRRACADQPRLPRTLRTYLPFTAKNKPIIFLKKYGGGLTNGFEWIVIQVRCSRFSVESRRRARALRQAQGPDTLKREQRTYLPFPAENL